MRIQSTAMKVNTIRRARLTSLLKKGEVEPGAEALEVDFWPRHGGQEAGVSVVLPGKDFLQDARQKSEPS